MTYANAVRRACEYAQRRATETNRRYFVTCEGHAVYDCAANRHAFENLTIVFVAKPRR